MLTKRWRIGIGIWGVIVLAYCTTIWPGPLESSPFSHDEAHLAAQVGVVVQFLAIWLLPVAVAWAIRRGGGKSSTG